MLPPLRPIRRFCHAAAAASPAAIASKTNTSATCSKQPPKAIPLQECALSKLKAERDPAKLFALFKANAHNKLVIENRFAFEDMVDRLAGARCFDYIEHLLEHQKTLPQGRREGFIVRIIMLYVNIKAWADSIFISINLLYYLNESLMNENSNGNDSFPFLSERKNPHGLWCLMLLNLFLGAMLLHPVNMKLAGKHYPSLYMIKVQVSMS